MADTHLWRLLQAWMDGQIVRVNQSQLAEALGVHRQSLSQWKQGQARPSPDSLRAVRRVTRIDWDLLTDALLRDMGYVEEETSDGTATTRAGASPAEPIAPPVLPADQAERERLLEHVLEQLPPEVRAQVLEGKGIVKSSSRRRRA